jgi:uncharacterized protein YbjT (DUF2867 family)
MATTPILLTGGTGTLGRHVLPLLQGAGHDVRVLSRRSQPPADGVEHVRGDLTTGAGVDDAVRGVATVLHCAGDGRHDEQTTRTLVTAATSAGVSHLVLISVVGVDRMPVVGVTGRAMFGYFAAKRAAEAVVAGSDLPWTTLRATQFHDLVLTVVRALAKPPVALCPTGRFQPVETAEVAERLVTLADGSPSGLVTDLAGPREHQLPDLLRGYLRASGRHRRVVPVRLPGPGGRAVRDGALLGSDADLGTRGWEDFLAARVAVDASR